MHQEFEKASLATPVHILAVNGAAFEAGLELINAEGSRPVLQDLESVDLWGWDITYRDVGWW